MEYNYGFSIWDKNIQADSYPDSIATNITEWFWELIKITPYINRSNNIDKLLHDAYINKIDYLFIFSKGSFTNDPLLFVNLFFNEFHNKDFLFVGHILDRSNKDQYYEIHHQCMVVNIKKWNEIGKPLFGTDEYQQKIVRAVERSKENIHDDYTPLWIKPKNDHYYAKTRMGYNFISESMSHNLIAYNFTNELRENKMYCYQEYNDSFNRTISDFEAKISRIRNHKFLFNMGDNLVSKKLDKPVDRIFVTASGFNVNSILEIYGFSENTEVVLYDVSMQSLRWKWYLHKKWNGTNLKKFVDDTISNYDPFFMKREFVNHMSMNIDEKWNKHLDEFGGESKWINHWNRFRKLKFDYLDVNLLGGNDIEGATVKLFEKRVPLETEIFYFTNIFTYFQSWIFRGKDQINISWNNFTNDLMNYNKDIYLLGSDPVSKYYHVDRYQNGNNE